MEAERALFLDRGWLRFDHDPATARWAAAALARAFEALSDPALRARDLRCGETWFVGVDAIPNAPDGSLPDAGPPGGPAFAFLRDALGLTGFDWHRAQASIVFPGYPRPSAAESPAAFAFRRDRDAAHVDGVLPFGPDKRRRFEERHLFVLGLPMTEPAAGAAPMTVWEGSHHIMRAAFAAAFEGAPPEAWREIDVTEVYQAARRRCFDTLPRVELSARPGEAYLVHRLALHGVAPWRAAEDAGPRAVAYLRPDAPEGAPADWALSTP